MEIHNIDNAIKRLENRDFAVAKSLFSKLTLEKEFASMGHAGLANCYARENNLISARRELEEAVRFGEFNLLCFTASALIADREGRSEEAKQSFSQALMIEPKSSYANLMFGAFLLSHNDNYDAVQYLSQAKAIGGENWVVNRNLAIAYSRIGKRFESLKAAFLSFISRPSVESFEILYQGFFRTFRFILLIIFGVCLAFFFLFPNTPQGVAVPVMALIAAEYANYTITKNRKRLVLILLYALSGLIYYLIFVK